MDVEQDRKVGITVRGRGHGDIEVETVELVEYILAIFFKIG